LDNGGTRVEDAASEEGYHVIFCNTDESASKQESYLEAMIQKQVDGNIIGAGPQ